MLNEEQQDPRANGLQLPPAVTVGDDRAPANLGEARLRRVVVALGPADAATLLTMRFRDPVTVDEWRVWRLAMALFGG